MPETPRLDIAGFAIEDSVKVNDGEYQVNMTLYPPTYHAVPPIASRDRYFNDPMYHALVRELQRFIANKIATVDELYQAVRIAEELVNVPKETNADERESTAENA